MRLQKLESSENASASATQIITCLETGIQMSWHRASEKGWYADLDGAPFMAYYSPEGLKRLQERDTTINLLADQLTAP